MNKKTKILNNSGVTFIELLLYTGIFLIIVPLLMSISINAVRMDREHNIEQQINADSQFMIERIYDLITGAKKIDMVNSRFNEIAGKISLIMQDDSVVDLELDSVNKKIQITEDALTSDLSSANARVESLYFEKISDNLNDPEIALGINVRMQIAGMEEYSVLQNYVISANLEDGDFDEDGTPDYFDKFPHHPECSGDADDDGICDELDNCPVNFNPFQEDFDGNSIGSACDLEDYDYQVGFPCNPDQYLLDLINETPPIPTGTLKNVLMSASPLSPTVLNAMLDRETPMSEGNLKDILLFNVKLPDEIFQRVMEWDYIPIGHKNQIEDAQEDAEDYAWQGQTIYDTIIYEILFGAEGSNITYQYADHPLGENSIKATDTFEVTVSGSDLSERVTVTTTTNSGSDVNVLDFDAEGSIFTDIFGFEVSYDQKTADEYIFRVSNVSNTEPLISFKLDFKDDEEDDSIVTSPTGSSYIASRYVYYCPGGCAESCGDSGTGIAVGNYIADICYTTTQEFPEWCSIWTTFNNDNSSNPAYVGGTQEGEETVYWEKKFKAIITPVQIEHLESIVVGGEVAYQSIAQLFCDQYSSSCPMDGNLIGSQSVELYNWDNQTWVNIGVPVMDGETSDQQIFEIKYDNSDVQKFVGGEGDRYIKARFKFNWDGIPPQGEESAPCFMLIDYFTLHLKW